MCISYIYDANIQTNGNDWTNIYANEGSNQWGGWRVELPQQKFPTTLQIASTVVDSRP